MAMSSRRYDKSTMLLFVIYVTLLIANLALTGIGWVPWPLAFLVGLAAFNLSFTIWHECVHNTIASDVRLRIAVGWTTAFFMMYPGYFLLRREHLFHHKYQGDPEKDPVYPRVNCPPWAFPLRLVWVTIFRPQPRRPESVATNGERRGDLAGYLLFACVAAIAVTLDLGPPLLAAWILPRLVMFPIHAFYVCYLPHSARGKELYKVYRIVLRNPFTRYLMLYHSYHGLHHVWPTVPWHQYQQIFRARRAELEARGVEILGDA